MSTVTGQFYPTKEELKNIALSSLANSASRNGFTVNVLPASEYDMRFDAMAKMIMPGFANIKLGLQAQNPATAAAEDIPDIAAEYGVFPRPASPSSGPIAIEATSGTLTLPADYEASGSNGKLYKTTAVTLGATDSTVVQIVSIDGGADTELAAGDVVTWTSPLIGNLKRTATVQAGGISGGKDADTNETLRQRLLKKIRRVAIGDNWAHVAQLAEDSSSAIGDVYVYPACQGPSSYAAAVVAPDGDRTVGDVIVNGAAAAVAAELPGRSNGIWTTVAPQLVDVVFAVSASLPESSGGDGNGWLDAAPWPSSLVKVNSYASGPPSEITTNAVSIGTLVVGSHIAIWSPTTNAITSYEVSAVTLAGTVKIQVVGGFLSDPTGAYISAGAVNIEQWAANTKAAMLKLGPGEKTDSVWLLPRALRRPDVSEQGPQILGSRVSGYVQDQSSEIIDISYAARYATGTTTPLITPSLPAAITDPPNILVLKHLAFIAA